MPPIAVAQFPAIDPLNCPPNSLPMFTLATAIFQPYSQASGNLLDGNGDGVGSNALDRERHRDGVAGRRIGRDLQRHYIEAHIAVDKFERFVADL